MPDPVISAPESLSWLNRTDAGRDWLASLPDVLADACNRFELELAGPPFSGGNVSYVVPVERAGEAAVLKLQFQDRESRHEGDALKAWNGMGAIRLLDHAPEASVLLLERCRPGHFLADDPTADKLAVLADILRKLLVPAGKPFNTLTDEAAIWGSSMERDWLNAGKPCEKRLVDAALAALSGLSEQGTPQVLLHQDLHGHNVLSSEREPWLAIDPKPLVGDPAFCLSPIVRSFEFGHSRSAALYRLDRLSEELELDRDRARLWTIGQTMAWAFSSSWSERHFETTRWLLD
ncbi:aminoglycoside phosphotransferase family protein [uncultured Roseibium sp.]|uniref:aminoglycoside phosphotransferase family protein n=1 Tax=uncultured Roseibium sp. TaxID=1936171 RepID=UPI0026148B0D|nr:aminoglycoside phosphotransferase family protein [uncultured Roseibium sp.]